MSQAFRLRTPADFELDHVRGGTAGSGLVTIVVYSDYLCPYCRRLRSVLARLRQTLGERLAYVFRHFPNEPAHPGAEYLARAAEAAGMQGSFWDMHDRLYGQELPITEEHVQKVAQELGLDMERFARDVAAEETFQRVASDIAEARRNGVAGTPTIFIDGFRYDGAWDFYSMLEALERPVAARLGRQARAFADLPASGGLVLLLAAAAALVCANSPLAPAYRRLVDSPFGIGPEGSFMSMTVGSWLSEGLLAVFFLLVGLEIRREVTAGALSDRRAAALPIVAAVGGVIVPSIIYLALNRGPTAVGWAVPTATDIAFTLGILALLGDRVPPSLRVFVAALAVVDDILSVLTIAVFYGHGLELSWLLAAGGAVVMLFVLNRSRVYATWPYALASVGLWVALHGAGVHGALAGVILAAFLPVRPTPRAGPLLAQAATALAALEQAEAELAVNDTRRLDQEPLWDWASRQLSAASDRLLSPADRIERAVAPWTAYIILPLFAFSATGVSLDVDLGAPGARRILAGVILGLVVGKPLGILLTSFAAIKTGLALALEGVDLRKFLGAACLCGVGDTVALLMADEAFSGGAFSSTAKIGVLIGSTAAAALGATILLMNPRGPTRSLAAPDRAPTGPERQPPPQSASER